MAGLKNISASLKIFNPARTEPAEPIAGEAERPVVVSRDWSKAWPHALVLLLYTVITLYFLQPLLGKFFTDVPFGGDSWIFYWDLWWVKKALTELFTNPFFTNYVNYPGGASLNFHTLAFLDGVMAIPLQWLGMSLAGAYNTLVLFGYIFSAYSMFLLADYVVKNKWAAFIAGLIFGFSPFHFAHLNGQLNFVSVQWMPFYLLFMLKVADNPRVPLKQAWKNILVAAVFLGLNALTEWTLAAFLGLLTVFYLLYRLYRERADWRNVLRGPVLRLVLVLVVFGVITSPVLLPMLAEARSNKNLVFNPDETIFYSADLLSFITPYEFHPILGPGAKPTADTFSGNAAERTTYLGFVGLFLAVVALGLRFFYGKRPPSIETMRGVGFWFLSGLSAVILALGPLLVVGGRNFFTVFKLNVLLPYGLFYYLPFFSIMRTPARFGLVAMLALAIVAAFGFKGLLGLVGPRLEKRGNPLKLGVMTALAGVVSLLILFEFAPYVTTATPVVPQIYNVVRQDTNANHVVLELPYRPASHFYIAQVAYNKPMIGGYLARQVDNPLVDQNPALKTLALRQPVSGGTTSGTSDQLKQANVTYVFVNWWMLDADQTRQMQSALAQVFNRPPDSQEMEPDGSKVRISLYIVK